MTNTEVAPVPFAEIMAFLSGTNEPKANPNGPKWGVYKSGKLVFSNADYDTARGYLDHQLTKDKISTFYLHKVPKRHAA